MVVISEYESDPRVRRQAEALVARGDEVTVLALHAAGRPDEDTVAGVRVVHLPVRKYRGSSAKAYLSLYGGFGARAAAWLARRPRAFDVVQAHSMPEALVFTAALPRLFGVPLLLDIHDFTAKLFASKFADRSKIMSAVRASEWAALRFADEVLVVHDPHADLARTMTPRPVTVVMNCPDDRLFVPRPPRGWDPAGEVVFSYHGLIAPRHGLENAVEALAAVRRDVPGARLQVRGGGDGLEPLRAKVAQLGLSGPADGSVSVGSADGLVLVGSADGSAPAGSAGTPAVVDLPDRLYPLPEIVAELDRVHIGLVPSQLDPWTEEVLPTKLMEYAILGIPVITFRNPVIERYFPADAVRYVDPASPQQLQSAMLDLARHPDQAMAQAARAAEVMRQLRWGQQKLRYFEVIDRLAARRPGARRRG